MESARTSGNAVGVLPKVFVVSDDRDCRDSLVSMLSAFHFAVAEFVSPEVFLGQIQKEWTGCLLLELTRAREGEIELLSRLRQRGIEMPTVIIAHSMDVSAAVRVMQLGALHVTETPYDSEVLRNWIQRGLDRETERHRKEQFQRAAREELKLLTVDEKNVLEGILSGWHNKVIASRLDIGVRTVQARRAVIMRKLNCQSVAQLVWKVAASRWDDAEGLHWCESEATPARQSLGGLQAKGPHTRSPWQSSTSN